MFEINKNFPEASINRLYNKQIEIIYQSVSLLCDKRIVSNPVLIILIILALRPNPTSFFVLPQKTEAKKVKAAPASLKKATID